MRTNGHISILTVSGGGLNEYGEPESPETVWSEPIPCSIRKNRDTAKGVSYGGEFRNVTATVHLEEFACTRGGRVRLETYDDYLGEFDILSVDYVPGSGRMKIEV